MSGVKVSFTLIPVSQLLLSRASEFFCLFFQFYCLLDGYLLLAIVIEYDEWHSMRFSDGLVIISLDWGSCF